MKIIIMRHGDAVFTGEDRVLSELGISEVRKTGSALVKDFRIDKVFCSPKTRARQTAAIVQKIADLAIAPEILEELCPSGDCEQICSYIEASVDENETLLLVSHLPLVAYLAENLLRRSCNIPDFVTATAFVLEKDGEKYYPLALYTPKGQKKY